MYVVYGFLFIRDKYSDDTDLKYLHLVDDIESFVKYPWGTAAYNFLVKEMHSAADKIAKHDSRELALNGFVAPFQIWVYEIFPNVGREFATKLAWRSDSFPRILRWSTARCPSRDDVQPHFTTEGGLEMVILLCSDSIVL